jgi:hypothetical protein
VTRHFLVIGAQRSGTTYLHSLLDAHPDITMARPARPEPKVFLSDDVLRAGLDAYRATFFAHATTESVLGEKSASYIEDPKAATRAAEVLGDPQILAVLRDPVERAVSNWCYSTENGLEDRPLETALRENLAGERPWDRAATSVSPFAYLERGRYVHYLRPWFAVFPTDVHVYFLSDLARDDSVLGGVYERLGVDPAFRPSHGDRRVNSSRESAPMLSTELLELAEEYFASSNAALSRLLGRALPWSEKTRRGGTDG